MRLRKITRKIEVRRCCPSRTNSEPGLTGTVPSGVPRKVTSSGGQMSQARVENGASPSHFGSHSSSAPTGYDRYSESCSAHTRSADQTNPRCRSGRCSRPARFSAARFAILHGAAFRLRRLAVGILGDSFTEI